MSYSEHGWVSRGTSVWSEHGCVCVSINTQANAHLISAAPDLLDALQELVLWVKQGDAEASFLEKADAAIDKALGN